MATKLYTKDFLETLPVLFNAKSHFINSFGEIDVLDGVTHSDTAFSVKVSDMDVVVNDYDTDKAIDGGRLGEMNEILSTNVDVPYEATKSINEGIDMVTIDNDIDQIVSERMEKQVAAITKLIDDVAGAKISNNAGLALDGELTEESVTKAFNDANDYFTENEVDDELTKRAYVTSEVYNFLVDSDLATTAKGSSVNVDTNTLYEFKGFLLDKTPKARFVGNENIYFVVDNIGKVFAGINEYRALDEHPEFFGTALQSLIKYGSYVPEHNQKAIVKATLTEVEETPEA